MIDEKKEDLAKLIEDLTGFPQEVKSDIAKLIRDKDTAIPDNKDLEVSTVIALLFSEHDPEKVLNSTNKTLIEAYSEKHLSKNSADTPSQSRKK